VAVLEKLFDVRPKLSAKAAHERLKAMEDPADGGLMFCWSKRGEVKLVSKSD